MIFKKYDLKLNTLLIKNKNTFLSKFLQKPLRNVNVIFNEFLIDSNNSIFENKINFNSIKINKGRLFKTTKLNKKKII